MRSLILLSVVLVSCSRTPDPIVIDVPVDSTLVPHKFLAGELARMNNEIETLRDSLANYPRTYSITWCDDQFAEGEILGSFDIMTTECTSDETREIRFYILWEGERAIVKRAPTFDFFNLFPTPPVKKS